MSAADRAADSPRPGAAWWAAAAAIVAAGAWLRLRGVADLHLILDERLVLRTLAEGSLLDPLLHHTVANNSPALTILARALQRAGCLDELTLRLPMLASGLLLLGLPLVCPRAGDPGSRLLHLALLAISAPLAWFTLVARPYAPALLAIGVAFLAWDRWRRGAGRAAEATLGIASAVAVFLHAFAAPVVVALLAATALVAARGGRERASFARVLAWAGAGALVLLAPGAGSFLSTHTDKVAVTPIEADLPRAVFDWLALGLGDSAALVALALAMGLAATRRGDPDLARAGALVLALPVVALAALRPLGGATAWARYALFAWPLALLFAARGGVWIVALLARAFGSPGGRIALAVWAAAVLALRLAPGDPGALRAAAAPLASWSAIGLVAAGAGERWLGAGRGVGLAAGLLVAGVLAFSPLRLYRQTPDSFRSHPNALAPLSPRPLPAAYGRVARDAGAALLECPDPGNLIHSAPYADYQQGHGERVVLLAPSPKDSRLRNRVDVADYAAQRRSGARYAIVHLDLAAEMFGADAAPLARLDAQAEACREALRAHWGPPVESDDGIEVYELRAPPRAQPGGRP